MKYLIVAALIFLMPIQAIAWISLPIADDAETQAGIMRVSGGIVLESDIKMYGGRFAYGIMDGLSVFGGLGLVDFDKADTELYYQLGAKYTLPLQLPVDLAVRAGLGYTKYDFDTYYVNSELDIWTLNVGALASKQLADMFTVYGLTGLNHTRTKYSYSGYRYYYGTSHRDNKNNIALAGGAIYSLNKHLSFYGELALIDDLFISLGARYAF